MLNFIRGLFLTGLVAAAVIAAGGDFAAADPNVAASPTVSPSPFIVHIKDFAFTPTVLKIPLGSTVVWKNEGSVAHTATSSGKGGFDSKNLDGGKTFSYTFTKSGTYSYACSYHPSMTGSIVVGEPQPTPTPTATLFIPPSPSGY